MIEESMIYRGEVMHHRVGQTSHRFDYPMTFFAFDLSKLSQIAHEASLFGYNQVRPLQIKDVDYLRGRKDSISSQLNEYLPIQTPNESTYLITSPRYFGYAFNPVNFYLRLSKRELVSVVAEVNNTFGDRHIYPLTKLIQKSQNTWKARIAKDFHVSPFNDMNGEYEFTFHIASDSLELGVDLYKNSNLHLKTWIKGHGTQLTNRSIIQYALLHPLDTALNSMPRILIQAAKLYFQKRLPVYKRPTPASKYTVIDRDLPDGKRNLV